MLKPHKNVLLKRFCYKTWQSHKRNKSSIFYSRESKTTFDYDLETLLLKTTKKSWVLLWNICFNS